MKVIYETQPRRYLVQELDEDGEWVDEGGYNNRVTAENEAERLQGLFPARRYRVVDLNEEPVRLAEGEGG